MAILVNTANNVSIRTSDGCSQTTIMMHFMAKKGFRSDDDATLSSVVMVYPHQLPVKVQLDQDEETPTDLASCLGKLRCICPNHLCRADNISQIRSNLESATHPASVSVSYELFRL